MSLALYHMPRRSHECGENTAPRYLLLVLLEGPCHRLWQYKLQKRSWFPLSRTFISQSLVRRCDPIDRPAYSPWSYVAVIDLALCLRTSSTSGVKLQYLCSDPLLDWRRAFSLKTLCTGCWGHHTLWTG